LNSGSSVRDIELHVLLQQEVGAEQALLRAQGLPAADQQSSLVATKLATRKSATRTSPAPASPPTP